MADIKSNLSQFVPRQVNVAINAVENPKAFGDQLVNSAKQYVKTILLSAVDKLKREIENTIRKSINLEINHALNLRQLKIDSEPTSVVTSLSTVEVFPPVLTEEEYALAVIEENKNYELEKKLIDKELNGDPADPKRYPGLKKKLENILLKDYLDYKERRAKKKLEKEEKKRRTELEKKLARAEKKRQITRLLFNVLSTIIIAQISEKLMQVITDNSNLQRLVDKTNAVIEAATTLEAINQARIARNSCINIINRQEKKVQDLLRLARTINVVLLILSVVLRILENILAPGGTLAKKLAVLAAKALYIVRGISTAVSIGTSMLESAIDILEDLKRQLRDLNQLIEDKTLQLLTPDELSDYLSQIRLASEDPLTRSTTPAVQQLINELYPAGALNTPTPNQFGTYKGFTFVIKEEVDTRFVVKGNKRHYVVAINTKGVEQLKSDYSFTLDPQQLVNQLKLVIDQQNLQG
jgi:hypothetical protein